MNNYKKQKQRGLAWHPFRPFIIFCLIAMAAGEVNECSKKPLDEQLDRRMKILQGIVDDFKSIKEED